MDWLDVFLYKIDLSDIDKFNSFHQKNKIIESLKGIDHYIDKIMKKKDKNYFQRFALISYNLKRFLHLKEKRKTYKKEKMKKIKIYNQLIFLLNNLFIKKIKINY